MILNTSVLTILLETTIEVLLAAHLLAGFLPRRSGFPLRLAVSSLGCILFAVFLSFFAVSEENPLQYMIVVSGTFILIFFAVFLVLVFCYEESLSGLFCYTIIGYTVQHMSAGADSFIKDILKYMGLPVSDLLMIVICFIPTAWLCYHYLSGSLKKNSKIRISGYRLLYFSSMVLLVDIVIGVFEIMLLNRYQLLEYDMIYEFFSILACAFILNIQAGLISNEELQTELRIVSQMLLEEKRQYEQSRSSMEIINRKCHDLKHQIRTIRQQGETVDPAVLKEIEKAVDIYDTAFRCGNEALDVILTEKKLLCDPKEIRLTCLADGMGLKRMSAPDIYALFGNILDNAMEAVSRLKDPENRSISLTVRQVAGMTVIHEENRFEGRLQMVEGLPETIKSDTDYHGFGMKSMKNIAESYDGCLTVTAENGIFSLTIMLPTM